MSLVKFNYSILSLLLLGMLLGSCSSTPKQINYFSEQNNEKPLVWPALPEVPRYRFAGQLVGETNFVSGSSEGSSFTNFMRWLVGLDEPGELKNLLDRPQSGVVLDEKIYITDIGRRAIFVFDEKNAKLHTWSQADQDSDFIAPIGIASDDKGTLMVADAELARVVLLDREGNPLGSFGQRELKRPTGLTRDPATGLIYVADTAEHNIKVYSKDGQLKFVIGERGSDGGQFNGPTHLSFSRNTLVVSDTLNARVQLLSPEGKPRKIIGRRGLYVGNLTRPKGVTLDDDGNLYVVEGYYDHLLIFNEKGELLLPIGGTGTKVGEFFLPTGLWIDNANRIFMADMFNSRVVMFQYLGK